jgi:hypothetical protein
MHISKIARIALLAVVAAALALSCSLDYMLDFDVEVVSPGGVNYVDVDYSLYNSGSKTMYDATIHILVSDGTTPLLELATPGVDLNIGESAWGTLTFTLASTVADPRAVVVGSGWNDASDL